MTADGAVVVIDASVAVEWMLDEHGSAWARALPASAAQLIAPDLLCTECGDVLWRMARAKRIEVSLPERFLSAIEGVSPTLRQAD